MTTLYPGALDSYSTKVDGVTDVMAVDINDPQDAIEALEAQHQKRSLRKIKNGSGATVAVNKIGYFDVAGDFVTTTTASFLASPWAAVISGGANNTQIVVGQGRVTVELIANCSIGDFLISSTTAGRAGVVAVWEPAVIAVALTANTGGAGGTCEAMLFPEIGFWVGFGIVVDEVRARSSGGQDTLDLGDVGGAGDVDIDFNDGQMSLQGSTGNFGVGVNPATEKVHMYESADFADFRCESGSDNHGGRFFFATPTGSDALAGLFGSGYVGVPEYANKLVFQTFGRDIALAAFGAGDEIHFYAGGRAAGNREVTINSTGMGINNVTSPSTALDIGAGAIEGVEMTAPGAGAANTYRLYAEDNGAGKTRLMVIFATGAAQQVAIQP